jgi:hypothetical protein
MNMTALHKRHGVALLYSNRKARHTAAGELCRHAIMGGIAETGESPNLASAMIAGHGQA